MPPEPRPEVIALLAQLFTDRVVDGDCGEDFESRYDWSTGGERTLAVALVSSTLGSQFAEYRRAADQQDAELRRDPRSDAEWLRDVGVAE